MKKKYYLSCICLILSVLCCVYTDKTEAQEKKKYTIGILNLEAKGVSNIEAGILSDELRHNIGTIVYSDEYVQTSNIQYDIVERTEMEKILIEFEFSNCFSDSCALELGRMLQADRMILGSVGKLGQTYTMSARIIDVETGKNISTASRYYRGEIDKLLTNIVKEVANDLLSSGIRSIETISPENEKTIETIFPEKKKQDYFIRGLFSIVILIAGLLYLDNQAM